MIPRIVYLTIAFSIFVLQISNAAKSDQQIKLLAVGSFGKLNESGVLSSMMQFAADWVNNQPDLVPNAHFVLDIRNCGPASGNPAACIVHTTQGLMEGNVTGVVSGAFTTDQRVIQFASAAFKTPQISGSSSGPLLSNKQVYPYFMRTSPSDALAVTAMVKVMVNNGWKNAIMCYEDGDYGGGNRDAMQTLSNTYGITLESMICQTGSRNFTEQTNYIKSRNHNIIIPMLNTVEAYYFFDACNTTGLFGPGYIYLLPNTVVAAPVVYVQSLLVNNSRLNVPGLRALLDGAIGFQATGGQGDFYIQQRARFLSIYPQFNFLVSTYTFYSFDAVLAYAYCIDKMMRNGMTVYDINRNLPRLYYNLVNTTFNGTTGYVYFDDNGDRQGKINVHSFTSTAQPVAQIYDKYTDNFEFIFPIIYPGNSTQAPNDMVEFCKCSGNGRCMNNFVCECTDDYTGTNCSEMAKQKQTVFNRQLAIALSAIVTIGGLVTLFSAIMLAKNYATFGQKYGTFYCAVIILGGFLSYAAAGVLLPRPTDGLCLAFPWLLGVAFTLVYGCLFIKAAVLYKIWRYAMQLKKVSVNIMTVVRYVGVALIFEIVFLIIWSAVDPPKVALIKMVDNTVQAHCHSQHPTFWTIFLIYKGLWLLFGVVIAVLTRNVIKEYNDFTTIAYAIYNNVILLVIAIPLAVTLEEIPNGTKVISVIVVVLAFSFTIIILFYDTWIRVLFPAQHPADVAMAPKSRASQGPLASRSSVTPTTTITTPSSPPESESSHSSQSQSDPTSGV